MIWSDKGFLLSKVNFKENSIIAKFYTEKHGKFSGIIYGATSKKLKVIYKKEMNYIWNITQKMKIQWGILKLKL